MAKPFQPWDTCANCGAVRRRMDLSDEGLCRPCYDREWAAQWGGGSAGTRQRPRAPWGKKPADRCAVPGCPRAARGRAAISFGRGPLRLCSACAASPCSNCRGLGRVPGRPGGYTCKDCGGSGVDKHPGDPIVAAGRAAARRALAEVLERRLKNEPKRRGGN